MVTHEPSFPQVVGACIYCGRRDEKLSDEHVIRYGLGGTWILKKASCGAHRDVTAAIEGDVLHHAWGPARAVLGIRTRRKQERANGFRVKVEIRGALKSVPVSTEGHPGAIIMPVFAPPGVLPVKPKIPGTSVVRLQGAYRSKKAKALAVQHNADAIRIRYPEPITFARVLAKIGY